MLICYTIKKCNVHVVLLLVGGGGLTCSTYQFFNQEAHLIVNDCINVAFLISVGIQFQTIAPEYDRVFLNNPILGFGIKTFRLATDRRLDSVSFMFTFRI